eukprot:11193479-Lingulodinium_polyedra.AAC.1
MKIHWTHAHNSCLFTYVNTCSRTSMFAPATTRCRQWPASRTTWTQHSSPSCCLGSSSRPRPATSQTCAPRPGR